MWLIKCASGMAEGHEAPGRRSMPGLRKERLVALRVTAPGLCLLPSPASSPPPLSPSRFFLCSLLLTSLKGGFLQFYN